ncbi:MAG: hypothetical protein HY290_30035 [Planctomycetia bacterium]|nr:hypothetical protein [Planctomycetia bacterium]
MQHSTKRTKIFVNRRIQGRILARMAKYWVVYNLVLWHALFLMDFQRQGIPGMTDQGPRMGLLDYYVEFAASHSLLLVLSAALLPIVLWDMLKLSHQIAGPLVRFGNSLRKMTAGEPVSQIQLRPGDLLGDFQEAFNEYLASGRVIVDATALTAASPADSPEPALSTTAT